MPKTIELSVNVTGIDEAREKAEELLKEGETP